MVDFLKKIIANKSMQFKDGALRIWGVPASIYSLFGLTYQGKLIEKGINGPLLQFWQGFYQSKMATNTMLKRFGYKKDILNGVVGHAAMLGLGHAELKRADQKNKTFIFQLRSEYALEMFRWYGKQKEPVCHFFRGQNAGLLAALYPEEEFLSIETKCIAKGDKVCINEVKPKSKWDLKKLEIKKQIMKSVPSPKELGCHTTPIDLPQRR